MTIDDEQFAYASPYVVIAPELERFARVSFPPGRSVLGGAIDLMHRIHAEFRFDPSATTVTTPVTRVLAERHGVCQDFAHLQISCLRALGLRARYVSGYLLTDPPAGQPRLIGADASHAWVSVRCPHHGWVDLDPTNDVIVDRRHVTIAWGRDYGDVSPLRGVLLGGAEHTLTVGVSVVPIETCQLLPPRRVCCSRACVAARADAQSRPRMFGPSTGSGDGASVVRRVEPFPTSATVNVVRAFSAIRSRSPNVQ